MNHGLQEAILLVGAATSPLEMRLAVSSALHAALPDLVHTHEICDASDFALFHYTMKVLLVTCSMYIIQVCCLVLLLDVETQQLAYFETNDSPVYLPTSGVVW